MKADNPQFVRFFFASYAKEERTKSAQRAFNDRMMSI